MEPVQPQSDLPRYVEEFSKQADAIRVFLTEHIEQLGPEHFKIPDSVLEEYFLRFGFADKQETERIQNLGMRLIIGMSYCVFLDLTKPGTLAVPCYIKVAEDIERQAMPPNMLMDEEGALHSQYLFVNDMVPFLDANIKRIEAVDPVTQAPKYVYTLDQAALEQYLKDNNTTHEHFTISGMLFATMADVMCNVVATKIPDIKLDCGNYRAEARIDVGLNYLKPEKQGN